MKAILAAMLLSWPVQAVQPLRDPDTGWPELPIYNGIREAVQAVRPVTVDMSLRADRHGFSSVDEPSLGIRLTVMPFPGRQLRLLGMVAGETVDARVRRTRREEGDEEVPGYAVELGALSVAVEPARGRDGIYKVTGLAPGRAWRLALDLWEGDARLFLAEDGVSLIGRWAAGRMSVRGRYLPQDFDPERLALLGALAVAVQLEPPRRGPARLCGDGCR